MSQLQDAALVWLRKHLESTKHDQDHRHHAAQRFGRLGSLMTGAPNKAAERGAANAQRVALALRKKWPKAPQTTLEVAKIKSNLDVGLAAMEALRCCCLTLHLCTQPLLLLLLVCVEAYRVRLCPGNDQCVVVAHFLPGAAVCLRVGLLRSWLTSGQL